jgi:hypothetical protein
MDSQSNEFEKLRGQAAIAIWADLSRESQEILFEAAVSSDADAEAVLKVFCTTTQNGSSSGERFVAYT